jgi:hypothetical protein
LIIESELVITSSVHKKGWKKIIITRNGSKLDKGSIRKMKKEASRYNVDAIIFKEAREEHLESVIGHFIGIR